MQLAWLAERRAEQWGHFIYLIYLKLLEEARTQGM
jgi:hypothetical protein